MEMPVIFLGYVEKRGAVAPVNALVSVENLKTLDLEVLVAIEFPNGGDVYLSIQSVAQ
jgi:hypothetical protein